MKKHTTSLLRMLKKYTALREASVIARTIGYAAPEFSEITVIKEAEAQEADDKAAKVLLKITKHLEELSK